MKIIKLKYLNSVLHLSFDYGEFSKVFELEEDHSESGGVQCGNGIWINSTLNEEEAQKIVVHETCHYLDWLWKFEFQIENIYDSTEIRARVQEELFDSIMREFKKNIK